MVPDAKRRALAQYCGLGLIALAVIAASVLAAPGLPGLLGAGLGVLMMTIAVVDARHFIIPNALTLAAFGLALVNAGIGGGWEGVIMALLRGAVVALGFLIVRIGYQWLRGRQGIGLGDVKLAGVAGAWLGWTMLPIAVDAAAAGWQSRCATIHESAVRPVLCSGHLAVLAARSDTCTYLSAGTTMTRFNGIGSCSSVLAVPATRSRALGLLCAARG